MLTSHPSCPPPLLARPPSVPCSDYFDQLYAYAIVLIKKGKAYVDHQTKEEMEASR